MTATDTEAALLAAIRENPGEDAPRLVLADWLEENAGAVECEGCMGTGEDRYADAAGDMDTRGCPACGGDYSRNGTGRVTDGRAELAEFVRVQVELAKRNPRDCNQGTCRTGGRDRPCTSCRNRDALRARERELWPAVRKWFEGEGCNYIFMGGTGTVGNASDGPMLFIQRGLPSVVRCTLAEWMGGELMYDEYDIMGDNRIHRVVTGRAPGIGPRLAQAWPIERVEVTDAVIHPSGGNSTYYVGGLGIFPKEFWRRLEGHRTPSAARSALSDVAIEWARGQSVDGA